MTRLRRIHDTLRTTLRDWQDAGAIILDLIARRYRPTLDPPRKPR